MQLAHPRREITLWNRLASSLFVAALGHYKERLDAARGAEFEASRGDYYADVAGIVTGNILQWEL